LKETTMNLDDLRTGLIWVFFIVFAAMWLSAPFAAARNREERKRAEEKRLAEESQDNSASTSTAASTAAPSIAPSTAPVATSVITSAAPYMGAMAVPTVLRKQPGWQPAAPIPAPKREARRRKQSNPSWNSMVTALQSGALTAAPQRVTKVKARAVAPALGNSSTGPAASQYDGIDMMPPWEQELSALAHSQHGNRNPFASA
jgi:cytoskeletal protein RodZ